MAVKVCDAIMGTGKTSAAITYINEHLDQKFIYVTPYLSEATRIRDNCPQAHFIEPSNKLKEYHFKKSEHTAALIHDGYNITTTHQAFKGYTRDVLEDIKSQDYVLIIDENVEVLETFELDVSDLQLAIDAGYISESNGVYRLARDDYKGKALSELFRLLRSRELVRVIDENEKALFYWALPPDLITSFTDVIILTYLFEGQSLHHFLQIYDIPYSLIGIDKVDDTHYRFGDFPGYTPEYVHRLKDILHIINSKINDIGDDYHALSMNWFKRGGENVERLKRNISNYYNNMFRDKPSSCRLWGSYNTAFAKTRGKGYSKSFLTFNAKATNQYRNRDCLVYISNIFMSVCEKKFYKMHGIDVDEDSYALSIMIQWIWRSAIRDGKEVFLYIPSKRMRELLIGWIDLLSKGE